MFKGHPPKCLRAGVFSPVVHLSDFEIWVALGLRYMSECDREYGFLKIRRVILIHKEGTPRAIMMGKNAIYFFDATKINK